MLFVYNYYIDSIPLLQNKLFLCVMYAYNYMLISHFSCSLSLTVSSYGIRVYFSLCIRAYSHNIPIYSLVVHTKIHVSYVVLKYPISYNK